MVVESRATSERRLTMRVLILSQWCDPEPTFKGVLFAQELQRRGHEVQILTGFPNYPGGTLYPGYRVRWRSREVVGGVQVLRVPLYPSHDGSALRRVANYASFALSASVAAFGVRKPDVTYVYHPPASVALPAMVLKARGVPFVYDVQDMWPETLAATGMIRNAAVLKAVGSFMGAVYRAAAETVVLSQGFHDALVARGVRPETLTVIPNWTYEDRLEIRHPGPVRAEELGFAGRFNVVFAGTMGPAQAMDTVLEAAALLEGEPDLRFVLVGGGIETPRLEEEIERRGLKNVVLLPRRPVEEVGELLALADVVLVHLRDDPLFAITVPSKTQSYLMSGRPILMGVRGDAAAMVEAAGAGLTFPPEDARALAAAVLKMEQTSPEAREAMGRNGARFYRDRLSLRAGVDRFVGVLNRAALRRPRLDAAKRVLDVAASSTALALLALPMSVLAVVVRQTLGAPVLFTQQRPGQGGKPFIIYKFRTMNDARGADGELLPDRDRITPFGALLRRTSLDEFPELWNVLKGDMSLVGPRPLLTRYSPFFTEEERLRFLVRPGITGWAQVNGRNSSSWDDRLSMDAWYVRSQSLRLDFRILAMTVSRVFSGSGVVVDPESVMANLDDARRSKAEAP